MRALKKTLLTAAMAAGLSYGASAQAFVVDLFDDPADNNVQVAQATYTLTAAASGLNITEAMEYPGGPVGSNSILGGYRDVVATLTASNGGGVATARAEVGGGSYSFSTSSGDIGMGRIQWDGQDAGPNVADLNPVGLKDDQGVGENLIFQPGCPSGGCDRFVATVLVADLGFQYSIGVYSDADNYSILTSNTVFEVESPTPAVYLFEWFQRDSGLYFEDGFGFTITQGSGGAADFTNIGALELIVNSDAVALNGGRVAVDLALDSITKVPEPGVLALMGIGLLGATLAGRRRQGAKA